MRQLHEPSSLVFWGENRLDSLAAYIIVTSGIATWTFGRQYPSTSFLKHHRPLSLARRIKAARYRNPLRHTMIPWHHSTRLSLGVYGDRAVAKILSRMIVHSAAVVGILPADNWLVIVKEYAGGMWYFQIGFLRLNFGNVDSRNQRAVSQNDSSGEQVVGCFPVRTVRGSVSVLVLWYWRWIEQR